jgi:hypothetical protein
VFHVKILDSVPNFLIFLFGRHRNRSNLQRKMAAEFVQLPSEWFSDVNTARPKVANFSCRKLPARVNLLAHWINVLTLIKSCIVGLTGSGRIRLIESLSLRSEVESMKKGLSRLNLCDESIISHLTIKSGGKFAVKTIAIANQPGVADYDSFGVSGTHLEIRRVSKKL